MTVYFSNQFTVPAAQSSGGLSNPLLQQADITWLGAFKVPTTSIAADAGKSGTHSFAYAQSLGIAYNPANNSLFVEAAHDINGALQESSPSVCEISIPTLVQSSNIAALNTASIIQPFTDLYRGVVPIESDNGTRPGGFMVSNGNLFFGVYDYYSDKVQPASHFKRSITLSNTTVSGPTSIGTWNQRYNGGGMATIPADLRPSFGNYPHVTGLGGTARTGNSSSGPCIMFCDLDQVGAASISGTAGIYYPNPEDLGVYGGDHPTWTGTSQHRGTAIPSGYRTFLCWGRHGTPTTYPGGAVVSENYYMQIWAYDANEVKAAFDGTISPGAARPYALIDLGTALFPGDKVSSMTYDDTTRRMYVAARRTNHPYPVYHVFQIA